MAFAPFPRDALESTLPSCFLSRAQDRPDELAVVGHDGLLTYQTLAERSAAIANSLDSAGLPSTPLPLLVEQSAELVATILGILRSGRAYAPLDASLSDDALRSMLGELGATSVVADGASAARVRELGARAIVVARSSIPLPGWEEPTLAADDLAYIYFTSGTTAAAKGVMDTHRNVLHNVMRYVNGLEIAPDDRLTLLQGPAFSGAASSMFAALLSGACVFPYDVDRRGLGGISAWLEQHEITIYHSVPSIFRHGLADERALPSLRLVRLEGDRAAPQDLELFRRRFRGECTLVNGLGATECGIVRRLFVKSDDDSWDSESTVPIGYPVEDMDVRVEDARGGAVPTGTIGEIVVRSRFLSPGYWQRPDLTAERFRDEREPGMRAYRTGDLGRLRADGCLEHLGRADFQIKLHGRWIETDAVEHALRGSGLVAEASLAARERSNGDTVLVGYVVPHAGTTPTVRALRKSLADAVPANAIPHEWIFLDTLPLTANGKLDRQALASRAGPPDEARAAGVEPRTDTERLVVELWQEVLEHTGVGIDDDFVELGGDSLSAAIVTSRLANLRGATLAPDLLLRAPTVRLVAEQLDVADSAPASGALFNEAGTSTPLVLLHGDYVGAGLYAVRLARALDPDHPTLVLGPHRPDDASEPQTVEEMAAAFRARVEETFSAGPIVVAGYGHAGGLVAFELARSLGSGDFDVLRTVLVATIAPHPATRFLSAPVALAGRALRLSPLAKARAFAKARRAARALVRAWRRQASWHPTDDEPSPATWRAVVAGYAARSAPTLAMTLVSCAHDPSPNPTDPGLRWRRLCGELSTIVVETTSELVVTEHLDTIAELLQTELSGADQQGVMGSDGSAALRC